MGHDYGVPLRFLSITPTRDNDAAPGNRLQDKHSKLFHGKTLDEWTMIQLWSSKYAGKKVFVCETEAHADKLYSIAGKYGIDLYVRPRDFLHPLNDTGGVPIQWAAKKALAEDYHTLITTPFVVSPCRPPGFFDWMVDQYCLKVSGWDYWRTQFVLTCGFETDLAMFELDTADVGTQLGISYLNRDTRARMSTTQHYMALTHWWISNNVICDSRHDIKIQPVFVDIEKWQDIHIDSQDDWDWAEWWFAKKILSQGGDCYERYRETWINA